MNQLKNRSWYPLYLALIILKTHNYSCFFVTLKYEMCSLLSETCLFYCLPKAIILMTCLLKKYYTFTD